MLTLILAILIAAALKSRSLLRTAFDGRHSQTEEEAAISRFDMKPEMTREQTKPRISGWLSVLSPEDVAVRSERGMLRGQVFPPLSGDTDAPWAILFHGGEGTDGSQMLDVACELSLAGYRVLVPDLYAHGNSDGGLSSLGAADAQDVLTWLDWVLGEKPDARVVLMGQDEGALAVLLAQAKGLPQAVTAAAAESPTLDIPQIARETLEDAGESVGALEEALLGAAYRLAFGERLERISEERFAGGGVPTLLFAGTLDEQSPAYVAQDIAAAMGGRAQVCLIEGATHGMARYVDPEQYYDALLTFFREQLAENEPS